MVKTCQRVNIKFEGRTVKKIVIFYELWNSMSSERKDVNVKGVVKSVG